MDKAWASEAQDRGSIPRGDAEISRKAKFGAGQVSHQSPKLKIARSSRAGDTSRKIKLRNWNFIFRESRVKRGATMY